MNTKRLHRVRSSFTAIFGAIAIFGVIAFAPKAEASDCHFKFRPDYRIAYEANQRAIERAEVRERARAEAFERSSIGFRLRNVAIAPDREFEQDKPKKVRGGIFARLKYGF